MYRAIIVKSKAVFWTNVVSTRLKYVRVYFVFLAIRSHSLLFLKIFRVQQKIYNGDDPSQQRENFSYNPASRLENHLNNDNYII